MIIAVLHDDQLGEPDPIVDFFAIDQPIDTSVLAQRRVTVLLSTTTN